MAECPFLDETDCKILYENEIKNVIAVERFKAAYFGRSSGTKAMMGVTRM
jgi:hypothetical protein